MKKRLQCLLVFVVQVFVAQNVVAQNQWQTIFKDSIHCEFTGVYFVNNDTGFVCGEYLYTGGNYSGVVYRTYDGGANWDSLFLNEIPISIQFINDTIGFTGGDSGELYETTDCGKNWVSKTGSSIMSDYSCLYFFDSLYGLRHKMQGIIQKTTNGGTSWQTINSSNGNSDWPGNSKIVFPDSLIGYLTMGGMINWTNIPAIAKTNDHGNTWNTLSIPSNFYPYSCYFFDSLSGFAVGKKGKISKTFDGGLTWTIPDSISQYNLTDIYFVNDSIGYIIGGINLYDAGSKKIGIIFKTIDRGNSWYVMDSSYTHGLLKMHFPNDSTGYAVGLKGLILKITNANYVNSILENNSLSINISVFPNPSYDFISFNFPFNQNQKVFLEIFDANGSVVLKDFIDVKNKSINVSSFSKGVYGYRIFTDEKIISQGKVLKM